jgi:hypothetical protein
VECGVPVKRSIKKLLLIAAMAMWGDAAVAESTVVLVTSSDSPIQKMTSLEVRKAYMGVAVSVNGVTVRAVRRSDDDRLNNIFLQSVIAMSQRSYERRLLSLALRSGVPRPAEVGDEGELLELLERIPASVSYMWRSDAEADPRVRIIRILWQGT